MKKSLFIILAIFILPIMLYVGLTIKSKSNMSFATNGSAVVYKFMSPMCSECQDVQKIIDKIKGDYDYIIFQEVNVGGNNASKREIRNLIKKYDITVVPTLVFIDNKGNFHKKIEVDMTEEDIVDTLDKISAKKE